MHCGCKFDHVLHFSLPMRTIAKTKQNKTERRLRIEDLSVCINVQSHYAVWTSDPITCAWTACVCVCVCLCHRKCCKSLNPPVEMVSDATTEMICQGEKQYTTLFLAIVCASANERVRLYLLSICLFVRSFHTLFSIIQMMHNRLFCYSSWLIIGFDSYAFKHVHAHTHKHTCMFAFVHGYNGYCNWKENERPSTEW